MYVSRIIRVTLFSEIAGFSLFCDQTFYVFSVCLFIYFFGGNTCRALFWYSRAIALMKSSTDELREHRSVIYAMKWQKLMNHTNTYTHIGRGKEKDESN